MKVLHVSTEATWRGGEQQTLLLMRGLAARGVAQELVCPTGTELARRASAAGLAVVPTPIRNEADVRALDRILRRIRTARPTHLHLHTSQAHGLGAAAARLAGRRRPTVVVTRRVEHSIRRHAFLGLDGWKYDPGADRVLCVSERVRDVLRRDGIADDHLAVVPDGVDVRRFAEPPRDAHAVRAEFGVTPEARVVGAVGHLDAAKGHADLLEAASRLGAEAEWGPLTVLLVGEGPEGTRLREHAVRLGPDLRLVAAGFRDDVPDLLSAMDVFVHPSRTEGLGSAVLEAMAAGRPIVAAAVGGVPEALGGGEAGRLVPPGDPPALAEALRELLSRPAEAERLATAARDRVRAHYTVEKMVEGTLAAYARAAAR